MPGYAAYFPPWSLKFTPIAIFVEEIFIFIAIFVSVRDNEALKNLSPKFKQILCIQNSFQLLLFAFCQMQE